MKATRKNKRHQPNKINMAKGFNFGLIRRKLDQTKRVLPIALAKLTENHFADAFKTGNLDEYKWSEVNRRIAGTK